VPILSIEDEIENGENIDNKYVNDIGPSPIEPIPSILDDIEKAENIGEDYGMKVNGKVIGGNWFNAPGADVEILGGVDATEISKLPPVATYDIKDHYVVIKMPN
jgi:hypothetical protein